MKRFLLFAAIASFALGAVGTCRAIARDQTTPVTAPAKPAPWGSLALLFGSLPIALGTFSANTHMSDGSIRLIEQTISLLDTTGTATTYILKTGTLKSGVKEVESEDQYGAYRGVGLALGAKKGSMTLQFVNPTGDLMPTPLQYFSAIDASGASQKLILQDVGGKFGAFEEAMMDCTIRACENPAAVTATLPSQTPT